MNPKLLLIALAVLAAGIAVHAEEPLDAQPLDEAVPMIAEPASESEASPAPEPEIAPEPEPLPEPATASEPAAEAVPEAPATPPTLPSETIALPPNLATDIPAAKAQRRVRLEVGTRILHVELQEDTQGRPFENSFIGSIYKLEAEQDYTPMRPFVQVTTLLGPVELGAGISYDELEVSTVDDGGGDGDVEMKSWMFYLVAALPTSTRFKPFIELGRAEYENSFKPIASWYDNGRRNFVLDDSSATYVAGGCDIRLGRNFSANLYVRSVDVDVDGLYVFRGDDREPEPFTFTMEHVSYGAGLKYTF